MDVEAAALLRLIEIEQSFEALHDGFHVYLAPLWRRDVEDLARFIEGEAGRGEVVKGLRIVFRCCTRILRGCLCLFVGFCKGFSKYS